MRLTQICIVAIASRSDKQLKTTISQWFTEYSLCQKLTAFARMIIIIGIGVGSAIATPSP